MEAGRRGADARQPGQFPGRQRAVGQQRAQHRGPGRIGDQRGDLGDIAVVRNAVVQNAVVRDALGRYGHISTVDQPCFDQYRSMAENPAELIVAGVERCLEYAATWTLREIAEHVCHADAYAEEVGRADVKLARAL